MAGGEDSFGSGGYERTTIEKIMPVRFDSEKIKEQPDIALVLVIDRSGSMQGPKLEAAKESARVTAEVLSPNDYHRGRRVRQRGAGLRAAAARASNRMRISNDISRLQSGGGTNIYPGPQGGVRDPPGHQREGEARHPAVRRRGAARRHRRARPGHARRAHHGLVRRRAGRRPQPARR